MKGKILELRKEFLKSNELYTGQEVASLLGSLIGEEK